MMAPPELTIVSPVFQGAEVVAEFVRRTSAAAAAVTRDYELILIDDGSTDDSWLEIAAAAVGNPRVKGIRLSRNLGQHLAIRVGLANASGDPVVVMDCDLQDDPRYIGDLVAQARAGFDVVLTRRRRQQPWPRRVAAAAYFGLVKTIAPKAIPHREIGGYSLLRRPIVTAVLATPPQQPYLAALLRLRRLHTLIPVESPPRFAGRSSYTLTRLVGVALLGPFGLAFKSPPPLFQIRQHVNFTPPPHSF